MRRALAIAIAALMTGGFALAAAAQDTSNSANNNAGPPGAGPQTMPATMSPANDQADHTPIMARPLPLTEDQKHRIFAAVGAAPVAQANAKPAQVLPSAVALQDLPPALGDIAVIHGYTG
jgi:Spy/CpxP family protein refolding chaperone